jgi:hypothetical protein
MKKPGMGLNLYEYPAFSPLERLFIFSPSKGGEK